MVDWSADPRGNFGKYERQFNAGEISASERDRLANRELNWIEGHCPHKLSSREPDHSTVWCGDCGKNLGASAKAGKGKGGGLIVVRSGPCGIIALALVGGAAGLGWGLFEAVLHIL
jgi:hypothetical protein